MFKFQANIIRRRKVSKSSLLSGLIAAGLLGYAGITYLELGSIPIIQKLVAQLGFMSYINWIYLAIFATLALLVFPALYTIMKKKVKLSGQVSFDEKHLKIEKGREKYLIPEEKLELINFELKPLPENQKDEGALVGGSYMKIPTEKGELRYELNINTPKKKEELLEMIEFLKIEHDVKVKVVDLK